MADYTVYTFKLHTDDLNTVLHIWD